MSRMKKKQYYDIEEVYKEMFPEFLKFAKNRLLDKDQGIDAVHAAFAGMIEWKNRNPDKPINPRVMFGQVWRECRKINRHMSNGTISLDDPDYSELFRNT